VANEVDTSDVLLLIFVAFAPPLISFLGALVVTNAAEEVMHATTPQELIERFLWFVFIWLLIPILQLAVASAAARISIHSALARGLAPWVLVAGFTASLISIMFYDHFFSMLTEGWREMTQFTYIVPMFLTYTITIGRLLFD